MALTTWTAQMARAVNRITLDMTGSAVVEANRREITFERAWDDREWARRVSADLEDDAIRIARAAVKEYDKRCPFPPLREAILNEIQGELARLGRANVGRDLDGRETRIRPERTAASGRTIVAGPNRTIRQQVGRVIAANLVLAITNAAVAIAVASKQRTLIWTTRNDGRVRDSHERLHLEPLPEAGVWSVGGEEARWPRDNQLSDAESLNCRCIVTDEQGRRVRFFRINRMTGRRA